MMFSLIPLGVGAGVVAVAAGKVTHVALTATGPNRRPGEAVQFVRNFAKEKRLGNRSDDSCSKSSKIKFKLRFENYSQYVDTAKHFLKTFNGCNKDIGILPDCDADKDGDGTDVPILMDVFWSFNVPGSMRAHTSMMIVYKSKVSFNNYVKHYSPLDN